MNIFLQLTLAGADTGPFNLYSNIDSYTVPFVTAVPKTSLTAGYSTVAPSNTTTVQIKSVSPSICDSFVNIPLGTTSTTTSTTTCLLITYYELAGCDPADYAFTTIAPTLGPGQRYVLPLVPDPKFYTYTGAPGLSSCIPPVPYNGSIQATLLTGCPTP